MHLKYDVWGVLIGDNFSKKTWALNHYPNPLYGLYFLLLFRLEKSQKSILFDRLLENN